ncbi:hypothetical protein CG747_39960 [Streptomyces sp. CB02959]|nr:hypothetical protein CG747_39960 [Streptomyces sp. CB02959]
MGLSPAATSRAAALSGPTPRTSSRPGVLALTASAIYPLVQVVDLFGQVLDSAGRQTQGVPGSCSRPVVERTIAWLHGFRRLRIRWERRDDIHEAFLGLATCLVTHRHVRRLCQDLVARPRAAPTQCAAVPEAA